MYGVKNYLFLCSSAILTVGLASHAYAGPEGGSVAAGNANITQGTKVTDIHQSSSKAIIDWTSFDVAGDEAVNFHQPDSGSITLNRIHDHKASQIDGSITANGHVMLLNQNGVVFGAGSKVDVGSLTVSTADIDNDDFMAGRLDFNQAGQSDAAIINHGTITAKEAGLISLVAPEVENNGVIIAKLGKVQMAAADTFSLDLAGDGLIQVAVSDEDAKKLASNTGRITAEGGYVAITAGHARNIVDSVVENSGVIEAHSMTKVGGKIVLSADRGITKMSGTMNASGLTGGGSIKIGGDYQGSGEDGTANSARTFVSEDAVINASATETGNGGQTIVWADERTYFYGDIDASGIEQGGFAEVSGKQYLDFNGNVDLAGAKLGTLLLDPDDLDIVAGAANPADFADDQILFAENAGGTSTIGADTISGRLTANANLILQANNTIDVDAAITSTGAGDLMLETAAGGVITVNAAIDVNSGDLTLKADEIDILANLSGTGDVQLTSADINQEIEIGSTDASDLNLTATELAFLQDGWNSITIGGSDHEALIAVNDVVSFSDHTYIRNNVATSGNKMIDVNAAITTIDNSDLYLYGRGNGSSVHTWDGVHVVGDLDVARDLYVNTGGNDSYYNPTQIDVGRDMYITSGANIDFTKTLNVAGNLSITHYTGSPTYGVRLFGGADWNIGGNLNINSTHATAGTLTAYSGSTVDVGGDVDILFGSYIYNGTLTAAGAGDINLIGKAGGTTTIGGTIDSGAGNLTIKADEIDISANLSGTGDIQLTSADINQAIELGSTDAADLNLEATELVFLQDGWNSITIGGSDHEGKIEVNENVSFSDHTYIRNELSYDATVDKAVDINASITTSDSADLYLYGRANNLSTHGYDGVNVSANLNIARDLYVQSGSGTSDAVINSSLTQVGRDFILRSGNNSAIYNDLIVGRDLDIIHSTNNSAYQMYLHAGTIDVAGNISIAQSNTGKLRQLANSILEADGNITITANDVDLDSAAQIRSGSGTSTLTFLETGENADMELGGTSQGATWQMETAEFDTIQDGFSSVVFGSSSYIGDLYITGALNAGTNDLIFKADEIDISANMSGTGDIQLTSADVNQEIEIGSTDAADLNLTATELGFLQDGWNSITIGGSDHIETIAINEAISFSDDIVFRNQQLWNSNVDIVSNAAITTTDSADLSMITGWRVSTNDDVTVANDWNVTAGPGLNVLGDALINVAQDFNISLSNNLTVDADINVGRDFYSYQNNNPIALFAGHTISAGRDLTLISRSTTPQLTLDANSALMADGDILLETDTITIDPTASISGNVAGTSNLTFVTGHQNTSMELGGTSAGHTWNLSQAEIATIQDGFSSITFGSTSFTESIDITGDVSFSDDVIFRQNQTVSTAGIRTYNNAKITTTDSADASFYSDAFPWQQIRLDVDGDALLDGFSTITYNNSDIIGDLTSNAIGGNNVHSGATVNVGGDLTFTGSTQFNLGYASASNINVDGDISITSSVVNIYNGSTISGNVGGTSTLTFLEYDEDEAMELGGTSAGHAWQMTATELAAIQDGFSSITFGSANQVADIHITNDVTFSDSVIFRQDRVSTNIGRTIVDGQITVNDGGDLSFYAGDYAATHFDSLDLNDDLIVAGDLYIETAGGRPLNNSNWTIGGDATIYTDSLFESHGSNWTIGGDLYMESLATKGANFKIKFANSQVSGDLTAITPYLLSFQNNASIQADGDILLTTGSFEFLDSSDSISGNAGGGSTLTFLEYGQDDPMELGGTTAGHYWQMSTSAVDAIQEGFSSITFGSSSMAGGIDITGNISFSDDVIFRQDQLNATSGYSFANSASITTTDSANASFYGDNSYSLTNIKATVDGDLLLDGFSTVMLSHSSTSGDLTIQNNFSNSGLHSGVVVNVGGDALFDIPAFFQMGFSSSSTLNVDGDLSIKASDVDIYTGSSISGNVGGSSTLTFLEYNQNGGMEIGATNTGYTWQMDDNELAAINSNFASVVFGSSSMSGDITIDSWDLNTKAYDVSLMANDIDVLGMSLGAGDVTLISSNDINLNAAVGNNAQGGDVYFVAGNEFINNVGAAGINAGNGRYLVYAASPAQVTKNGLSASNLYQRTYAINPPSSLASSSDYFVFASVDPTPAPPQSSNAIPEDFTPSVEYQVAANNFDNLLPGLPVVPGLNISNRISSVNDTPIKLKKDVALNRFANSREIYADVRLLEAELLKVDEPIVREYDLCSHSDLYCR